MNGKHIAAGTLRRGIGLMAASAACLAMVAGLYAAHVGGPVEAAAAPRTAAVTSIGADGRNREATANQPGAGTKPERRSRQHGTKEAAKRAEEQRIADEAAELKAGLEEANRQSEAQWQAQAAARSEAQGRQQAARPQQQAAQPQQAQSAPAPAPAPAPSGPVDHPIARVCGPVREPADCQGAIDQGGLVQTNYYPAGREELGTWTIFAAHNNEGGAWMLDVQVGDVVRIGGADYQATDRRTVQSGGTANLTSQYYLQTCDWTGGTAQLIGLKRL